MLSMALELARTNPAYEDMASKFFEHFVGIADAINTVGGSGLWDEDDGFYYDQLLLDGRSIPLRVRSMVGLLPLIAAEVLEDAVVDRLPAFKKRMRWFLENRQDLAGRSASARAATAHPARHPVARAARARAALLLDEREFLSPFGVRSLSRVHGDALSLRPRRAGVPRGLRAGRVDTGFFGGNSNWRGPVWFPSTTCSWRRCERYHHFYGDELRVDARWARGASLNLGEVGGRSPGGWPRCSGAVPTARVPVTAATVAMRRSSLSRAAACFTSTSTPRRQGLGASHRPAGPRW
jgi:glycogen debranching enzyme